MAEQFTGGCQCGQVRYRIRAERLVIWACHCGECQKQSASAFGLSLPVADADFDLEGRLASWERLTESGARTRGFFCPDCGSRIHHVSDRRAGWSTVKAGTLDDTSAIAPAAHIWVSRKQPWVMLDPAVPAHPTQPADMAAWRAAFVGDRA